MANKRRRRSKWWRTQTHHIAGPAKNKDPITGEPIPPKGSYRKTTFKTKAKRWTRRQRRKAVRWIKRRTRRAWRTTKRRVKKSWRQHKRRQNIKNRAIAHNRPLPQPAIQYQPSADPAQPDIAVSGAEEAGGAGPPTPPPDGAISTCRLGGACGNEIRYNGARQRWEHAGEGNAECFK